MQENNNLNTEFSFTSKEEKSKSKKKLNNNLPPGGKEYEKENIRIQNDAKDLILKTRNLMENLNMDTIKQRNIPLSLSRSKTNSKSLINYIVIGYKTDAEVPF